MDNSIAVLKDKHEPCEEFNTNFQLYYIKKILQYTPAYKEWFISWIQNSTYVESESFSFFRIPNAFLVRFFNPADKVKDELRHQTS